MNREVYLDNNATTAPLPEVIEAVRRCMREDWGNPSSSHARGRRAMESVEIARDAVRRLVGAGRFELLFTSGGTESTTAVFQTTVRRSARARIVTTTAEHSSIIANVDALEESGAEVERVPVDSTGQIYLKQFGAAVEKGADLVALHWVNGETGVVQPIPAIAELCAEHKAPLLVDGAQAIGKIPIDLDRLTVDYFSFSGHKFHGPQGIGGLLVREGAPLRPFVVGGDQEGGLRAGTQNLPGIVGLGEAARLRRERFDTSTEHVTRLRDTFEARLITSGYVHINGAGATRVGNTSNLRFDGLDGQALLARLDAAGVYAAQGSACTSHRPEPSQVLTAMGLCEDAAHASLRFSFSELNDDEDVELALAETIRHCEFLRSLFSGTASV